MNKTLGYQALLEKYQLDAIPHFCRSVCLASGARRVEQTPAGVTTYYPASYWPGEQDGEQLAFALRYEGFNLGILARLFEVIPQQALLAYIQSRPTGKYARRLWFLYEFLTETKLSLDSLKQGNYIELLDPESYYTSAQAEKVPRQRIVNNLLGNSRFCPLVRRTATLQAFEAKDLAGRCQALIADYSPQLLRRALNYLYSRETRSSFEIERETPPKDRQARFVQLLQQAEREDFCYQEALIDVQNRIVDPRYRDSAYRTRQNYVGETVHWQRERIHFVSPKPEDLPALMQGLIDTHQHLERQSVSPVIHAAVIAYGLVFLHPFEDGNGRLHRFLIHNILARRGFSPQGIMFPVSAAMLKNPHLYENSLDAFSRRLMPLINYSLDETGTLTVHNQTALWYRYLDLTAQAEALFAFVEQTLEQELVPELAFLVQYDAYKQAVQNILDLPDRQLDLLLRYCLQNKGTLSAVKRKKFFAELSDREVCELEQQVQQHFPELALK